MSERVASAHGSLMSVVYRCAACGNEHPSRVAGPSQGWLDIFLDSCGDILEPCPLTGEWVPVGTAGCRWIPEGVEERRAASSAALMASPAATRSRARPRPTPAQPG